MEFLPYLPSLLVVIGWWLVNAQNDRRESRKEARALIDRAKSQAEQIARNAAVYFCDGKLELAFDIKADLEALDTEFTRLPNYVKDCPLMGCLAAFADAVTGGDFESSEPLALSWRSPQMMEIARTRVKLGAELERLFRVHFVD